MLEGVWWWHWEQNQISIGTWLVFQGQKLLNCAKRGSEEKRKPITASGWGIKTKKKMCVHRYTQTCTSARAHTHTVFFSPYIQVYTSIPPYIKVQVYTSTQSEELRRSFTLSYVTYYHLIPAYNFYTHTQKSYPKSTWHLAWFTYFYFINTFT